MVRLLLSISVIIFCTSFGAPDWGFYGHRKINRMAIFTLPPEMFSFYKEHVEFITEHAVDPDKRRYATKHEAVRHYIDIDHWGTDPFEWMPKDYEAAIARYLKISEIRGLDTIIHFNGMSGPPFPDYNTILVRDFIMPQFYEDEWVVECDSLKLFYPDIQNCDQVIFTDQFSPFGILPYHLKAYQRRLVNAFLSKDEKKILRVSAEIGHYIGDAHVPLHTTENYNGQMTRQDGIHAFWESRLPELFADDSYEFFIGRAEYVENLQQYFWDMVEDSHRLLPDVLDIERQISMEYPRDAQYCFEERLGRTIEVQCREYSQYYHDKLDGMVEKRMRDACLAIGSIWYTSWVQAGQPDLNDIDEMKWTDQEKKALEKEDQLYKQGKIIGREHSN